MNVRRLLAGLAGTVLTLSSAGVAQVHGGNGGPQIQPPISEPRPPRPPRPQPPRPPIPPRPIYPPVVQQRLMLYPMNRALGRLHVFTGNVKKLSSYGADNQAVSLVAVGRWQVCERTKYRGHCETVTGRVNNLNRLGLARAISSVRYLGQ